MTETCTCPDIGWVFDCPAHRRQAVEELQARAEQAERVLAEHDARSIEEARALIERAEKAEAERDNFAQQAGDWQLAANEQEGRAIAAEARAEQAERELARHKTEPDPHDPDGWIRRSALNHWAERARAAESALVEAERERDDAEEARGNIFSGLTVKLDAANAALVEVQRERDGLIRECDILDRASDDTPSIRAYAAEARRKALEEVRKYGRHLPVCHAPATLSVGDCFCGFDAAIRALASEDTPGAAKDQTDQGALRAILGHGESGEAGSATCPYCASGEPTAGASENPSSPAAPREEETK